MNAGLKEEQKSPLLYQRNDLISASYRLSLQEKRLLMLAFSKINPLNVPQTFSIEVSVSEWCQTYGFDEKSGYSELKKASAALYDRSVYFKEREHDMHLRWISAYAPYENGKTVLHFAPPFTDYLRDLTKRGHGYTPTELMAAAPMPSFNAVRIYELARQYKKKGKRQESVQGLKVMLGMNPESYPVFNNFRRRVLDPCCEQVTKYSSDMDLSWTPVKKGRRIVGVEFLIKRKTQMDLFSQMTNASNTPSSEAVPLEQVNAPTAWPDKRETRKRISAAIMDVKNTDW